MSGLAAYAITLFPSSPLQRARRAYNIDVALFQKFHPGIPVWLYFRLCQKLFCPHPEKLFRIIFRWVGSQSEQTVLLSNWHVGNPQAGQIYHQHCRTNLVSTSEFCLSKYTNRLTLATFAGRHICPIQPEVEISHLSDLTTDRMLRFSTPTGAQGRPIWA